MQKPTNNPVNRRRQQLAWWQLLRIGNVFTAISNILAGALLVRQSWQPIGPLLVLAAASALLYAAGMVLNDAFDADLDAQERPERPIPSGQISRRQAFRGGFGLLALGLICSYCASWMLRSQAPLIVAAALSVVIVGYDAWWKKTEFGPSAMGICRYLNVLLGASIATDLLSEPAGWIYAAVVGMYTVGLTLFAREENEERKTNGQAMSGLVTLGSVGLLAGLPFVIPEFWSDPLMVNLWFGCLILFALIVVRALIFALRNPKPASFRQYVTILLLGFVILDTMAAWAAAGWLSGLIVLTLIVPPRLIARWAPMT